MPWYSYRTKPVPKTEAKRPEPMPWYYSRCVKQSPWYSQ
jgi:hypothetical protein